MRATRLCAFALAAITLAACDGGTMSETGSSPRALESVAPAALERLLNARIFFGHQSIGFNIIEGIDDVLRKQGMKGFVFTESREYVQSAEPRFIHSTIGQNGDPLGKIRDFDAIVRNGMGGRVDIAFMKLCFVDVQADTDVAAIFDAYKSTMARLAADFPGTTFVHMTIPLVTRQTGPKASLKKLLGRNVQGYADNAAREKLNALLRSEYSGAGTLFDVAAFESTGKDGSRQAQLLNGAKYYSMREEYTSDGGHLNAVGRDFIGEQLLVFLSGVAR